MEIGRLGAWIQFEDQQMVLVIDSLQDEGSIMLAAEVQREYAERHRINNLHRVCLHRIADLTGYSGPPPPLVLHKQAFVADLDNEDEGDEEEDSDLHDEASRLANVISHIVQQ